jgi:DNA-binding MarR family transcriptional regulator
MKHGSDLDGLLGYQLQMANLLALGDARDALAKHDITPAKLTALLLIQANPGCDQTALGRALKINRSSAMKIVNFLEERGLIERRAGRNLRTNALYVRPEGSKRVKDMVGALHEADEELSGRLSASERDTLFKLLRKLGRAKAKLADTSRAAA